MGPARELVHRNVTRFNRNVNRPTVKITTIRRKLRKIDNKQANYQKKADGAF